jgi:hypothetical protein
VRSQPYGAPSKSSQSAGAPAYMQGSTQQQLDGFPSNLVFHKFKENYKASSFSSILHV